MLTSVAELGAKHYFGIERNASLRSETPRGASQRTSHPEDMPTGPKGQKRPADVIGNAVRVMRIATGDEAETALVDDGKDPAAKALGRKGGAARAAKMTPERRAEIAKKAAEKRWAKP